MRATMPLYEGDSIIHYGGSLGQAPAGNRTATQSIWGALAGTIGRVFRWLERSAERARYRDLENYLAESSDLCDLERRMRDLEHSRGGVFDPYS